MQPAGNGTQPTNTTAMVMTGSWSVDDTKPTVQAAFRNKIPQRFKTNGIFEIAAGEEGLLVDVKGEWGRVFFYRGQIQIPGAKWLPFHDKLARTEIINPDINQNVRQTGDTVLNNYVRTLWTTLRKNTHALKALSLSEKDDRAVFGKNFVNNVNFITQGFTDRSRQLFSNGTATLDQIALLPRVTPTWPAPSARCIYIRLYRRRDGSIVYYAIYVGQTTQHAWLRDGQHNRITHRNSPHYNVARRSAPEDRLMIPIMVWDRNQAVSVEVLNMAEQTVLLMFNTYNSWVLSNGFRAFGISIHNQAMLLRSVSASARSATNWPLYNVTGTNTISPLFYLKAGLPFHCYRSPAKAGQRGMTTYRQARGVVTNRSGHNNCQWLMTHPDGTIERIRITVPLTLCRPDRPMYVVFEIMDDGKPHEIPYLGCPSAGPFEDFAVASSLAVAFEWFDGSSNNWQKAYVSIKDIRTTFTLEINNPDIMKPLRRWRRCMNIIQLLEGIDYTGPLNGFAQSLSFGALDVKELVVDHLTQTVTWRLRPRRSKPAPKIASFDYNACLVKAAVRGMETKVGNPPDPKSDFWCSTGHDARLEVQCDFCRYMFSRNNPPHSCERDPRFTDRWVCKYCAVMNRPCTWTTRSNALRYWGEGQPFLSGRESKFTACPTGPHKHLCFYSSIPDIYHVVNTEEPIEGRNGLAVIMAAEEETETQEELSGNENVITDDSEGED
ncbi:hypothetical protein FAUST_11385 [Fusarium austroamericanum]|uniref:Uncharacterized protein n=1 Tax=Fusarium austroamericanum TaxID=282268 RepID=A0AAN5Z1G8_FUSAU|nr:hypothetical protein FAUST_11385 [Fusarium austroamericanum]